MAVNLSSNTKFVCGRPEDLYFQRESHRDAVAVAFWLLSKYGTSIQSTKSCSYEKGRREPYFSAIEIHLEPKLIVALTKEVNMSICYAVALAAVSTLRIPLEALFGIERERQELSSFRTQPNSLAIEVVN